MAMVVGLVGYGCNCAAVLWNGLHVECSSAWLVGVVCVIGIDIDVRLVGLGGCVACVKYLGGGKGKICGD